MSKQAKNTPPSKRFKFDDPRDFRISFKQYLDIYKETLRVRRSAHNPHVDDSYEIQRYRSYEDAASWYMNEGQIGDAYDALQKALRYRDYSNDLRFEYLEREFYEGRNDETFKDRCGSYLSHAHYANHLAEALKYSCSHGVNMKNVLQKLCEKNISYHAVNPKT